MRGAFVLLVMACVSLALPTGAANVARDLEGPLMVTWAVVEDDTLFSWTPTPHPGASYVVYRGSSPDEMQPIGHVMVPHFHDVGGAQSGESFYGISVFWNGIESNPTIVDTRAGSNCVNVGMNGSVSVSPERCFA